jgi:hypothetical protein
VTATNWPARICAGLLATTVLLGLNARMDQAQHQLDASTDGRFHSCGLVTEQGVTEHLAVYELRCHPTHERTVNP